MTVILIVAAIVNLCYMIASLLGLRLDVENKDCADDVVAVRRTRNFIKFFPVFNVVVYVILIILTVVCG